MTRCKQKWPGKRLAADSKRRRATTKSAQDSSVAASKASKSRSDYYLSVYFPDPAVRELIETAAKLVGAAVSPFIMREMKKVAEKVVRRHAGKCVTCGRGVQ